MDIKREEKIENAENLFGSYYFSQGKEVFAVSSRVLQEKGLDGRYFWDVICPLLKKEGVLKSYSYSKVPALDDAENYANPDEIRRLDGEIKSIEEYVLPWATTDSVFGGLTPEYQTEKFREKAEKIRDIKKRLEDLKIARKSAERIHVFEVNADYFKQRNEGELKSKMEFDSNGVLKCGQLIHRFHRGERGEKMRIVFFRELWNERRFLKKGVEKIKGIPRTSEQLAIRLKLASEPHAFRLNKKKVESKLFGMIKGINRILKQKGFPARIERKGGIQLVILEK